MSAIETRSDLIALIARHLKTSSSPIIQSVATLLPLQEYRALPDSPRDAPVCTHLKTAEAFCPDEGPFCPISEKLRSVLPALHWVADYPDNPVLRGSFGHAVIASSSEIVMGCNLLAARTDYPAHAHPAAEIYLPLSDSAALYWQEGTGTFGPKGPGDIVLHGAHEPHAMTARDRPVLNFWVQFGEQPGGPAFFV